MPKPKQKLFVMGNGLLGFHIRALSEKLGYIQPNYNYWDNDDLSCLSTLQTIQYAERNSIVLNAIGYSCGMKENMDFPLKSCYINAQVGTNPINALAQMNLEDQPTRYISLLTSCAYGESLEPLEEKDFLTFRPHDSVEPHAIAKRITFLTGTYAFREKGLQCYGYILNNLYGPKDKLKGGKIVGTLIGRFKETIEQGNKTIVLWGKNGQCKREVVNVLDGSLMILDSIDKYNNIFEPINLGSGQDYTVKEIAETIADVMGYNGKIEWDHTKPEGAQRKILSVDKMNFHNIRKPVLSLREGIDMTVRWFNDNSYDYLSDYYKKAGL